MNPASFFPSFRLTSPLAATMLLATGCSSPIDPADPGAGDACPATTGEGITHEVEVATDTVWRAADGPHRVAGRVVVRDGATLTIEPCTEVLFEAGASLDVGVEGGGEAATLIARGTPEGPIQLTRAGSAAWSSVAVFAPSSAHLAHATIEGAGSDPFRENSSLYVAGDGVAPSAGQIHVDHVEVRGSVGHGVVLVGAAAFSPGSTELLVRGAGAELGGFPLVVGQHAWGGLPDGDLTGNARDEILVREDLANGFVGLQVDATVRALSVPYHVGTEDGEPLRIGSSSGAGFATLTLEPGVELRFHPGVMLRVLASPEAPLGALRARGTPDAPVRFTSAAEAPAPGDWAGLYFESPIAESNEIVSAIVEYAGGYCSCALASCSPIEFSEAAIVFDGGAPPSAFVQDTTFRESAGHGILRSWLDHEEVDFSASNRFEGIAGCRQTMPVLSDVVCPDVQFACAVD